MGLAPSALRRDAGALHQASSSNAGSRVAGVQLVELFACELVGLSSPRGMLMIDARRLRCERPDADDYFSGTGDNRISINTCVAT
jgi:hypothetical protein